MGSAPFDPTEFTVSLRRLADEETSEAGLARLFDALYDDLRALAGTKMRKERAGHMLQGTALLHETYEKLLGNAPATWKDKNHFYGVVRRAMTQILIDYARKEKAEKHGGAMERTTFSEALRVVGFENTELVDVLMAIRKLEEENPDAAEVIDLTVLGKEQKEIAEELGVSDRTVRNRLTFARMWLARELDPNRDEEDTP